MFSRNLLIWKSADLLLKLSLVFNKSINSIVRSD